MGLATASTQGLCLVLQMPEWMVSCDLHVAGLFLLLLFTSERLAQSGSTLFTLVSNPRNTWSCGRFCLVWQRFIISYCFLSVLIRLLVDVFLFRSARTPPGLDPFFRYANDFWIFLHEWICNEKNEWVQRKGDETKQRLAWNKGVPMASHVRQKKLTGL